MTDAAPREGWYVVTKDGGKYDCVRRLRSGGFICAGSATHLTEIPPDWTLGPRIDDLLRDAARYRWCREKITCFYIGEENIDQNAATTAEFDALIDAEIEREQEFANRLHADFARERGDG